KPSEMSVVWAKVAVVAMAAVAESARALEIRFVMEETA
ncbi:MAG: hypothetical protein ACJAQ3_000853, partial [Planctomycetota bacterium]